VDKISCRRYQHQEAGQGWWPCNDPQLRFLPPSCDLYLFLVICISLSELGISCFWRRRRQEVGRPGSGSCGRARRGWGAAERRTPPLILLRWPMGSLRRWLRSPELLSRILRRSSKSGLLSGFKPPSGDSWSVKASKLHLFSCICVNCDWFESCYLISVHLPAPCWLCANLGQKSVAGSEGSSEAAGSRQRPASEEAGRGYTQVHAGSGTGPSANACPASEDVHWGAGCAEDARGTTQQVWSFEGSRGTRSIFPV